MKVLVTGSTGLLAKGLAETAPDGAVLFGVHLRPYTVSDTRMTHLVRDVRDPAAMEALLRAEKFDAVVHAAGLAAVDQVERDPDSGRGSNLGGTRAVAEACRRHGSYLVYVSTNAVFDGTRPPYAEDAPTTPVHHYGRIKLECEAAAARSGAGCIARPILMYGWNHPVNRPNPVTWVYEKLIRGEEVRLVDDVFENPLYARQCGRALWAMVARRPSGIFHLAGATRVSRWELGLAVAESFGLDSRLVSRVDSSAFPAIARRPPDTTFLTRRMEVELGVRPMTLTEGLADMRANMGVTA